MVLSMSPVVVLSTVLLLVVLSTSQLPFSLAAPSKRAREVSCGVCAALVQEVQRGVDETAETHTVQVRFRVDEKIRVPYARTEARLLEIFENLCRDSLAKRYVLGEEPVSNELHSSGFTHQALEASMFGNTDPKLKQQLESACRELLDDHEEHIWKLFHRSVPVEEISERVCVQLSRACPNPAVLADALRASPFAPEPEVEGEQGGEQQQQEQQQQQEVEGGASSAAPDASAPAPTPASEEL